MGRGFKSLCRYQKKIDEQAPVQFAQYTQVLFYFLKEILGTIQIIAIRCWQKADIRLCFCHKHLNWNPDKNKQLQEVRGISFEEIALLIEAGQILGIEANPGYPNQKLCVLEIDQYTIVVPYVENGFTLQQATPSRVQSSPILR